MASALPLRAALQRGALLTIANWPVVLVEFAIESLYKMAIGVPIVGGAVMVAMLLGADLRGLLAGGVRAAADVILGSLVAAPLGLAAFLLAVGVMALGGALLMFTIKAGTLAVLAAADRSTPEIQRPPVRMDAVRRASTYSLVRMLETTRYFARRAARMTLGLSAVYGAIALIYVGLMTVGFGLAADTAWAALWPIVILVGTTTGVIAVAIVNLLYDLLRIVVIVDDCSVRAGFRRMRLFLIEDARQVVGIFAVMTAVQMLAAAGALMLTAGLTTVAFVPIAGLIVVPLQMAAWLIRGLMFQSMTLTALSAYQTQYRRFTDPEHGVVSPLRMVQA